MVIGSSVILLIAAFLISRRFASQLGLVAYWGLLAKFLGALALGLTYQLYYGYGDTFELLRHIEQFNHDHFVSVSQYFSGLFRPIDPHSGNPRSEFFIRFMSPIGLMTDHNYWLVSFGLALFSFWASWSLLSKTCTYYAKIKTLVIFCFGFFPTYLFWSSGLMKDTLINGCLMFLVGLLIEFHHEKKLKFRDIVLGAFLFYVLFMTRHYLAGIFAILALVILVDGFAVHLGKLARTAVFLTILLVGGYSIRYFFVRLRPERFPITFYELHEQIKAKSTPESFIPFHLEPTWTSLIINVPKAAGTGLFRPWIWEAQGLLQWMEAGLTTALLGLFLCSLILLRKLNSLPILVVVSIIFVLVLATALPLSTPNFGSLSRYRAVFSPMLMLLVAYIPYRKFILKDL